jgi:hypothetical protein
MEAELAALAALTTTRCKPFVCAIGGAKVADKVGVFENLLARVDAFVIGGGMANTFSPRRASTSARRCAIPISGRRRDHRARQGEERRAAPADRRRRRRRVRCRRHRARRSRSRTSATG